MDRNFLSRRAFSLIEMILAFTVSAVLCVAALYSAVKVRQIAAVQRVSFELDAVADAGIRYYSQTGAWPEQFSDLCPGYLTQWVTGLNPFGNPYVLTHGVSMITISTTLPKGLAVLNGFGGEAVISRQDGYDFVSITRSLESSIWTLKYEKKNIFKQ